MSVKMVYTKYMICRKMHTAAAGGQFSRARCR